MPLTDDEKQELRLCQQALAEAERAVDAAGVRLRNVIGPTRRRGTGGSDQGKSGGDS